MTNSAINKTPIDAGVVKKKIEASGLEKVGLGAIRELVRLVNEIEKETGLSSTTVARISKWFQEGTGGYSLMLNRISKNHHKTSSSSRKRLI